jgi:hypothetical protein
MEAAWFDQTSHVDRFHMGSSHQQGHEKVAGKCVRPGWIKLISCNVLGSSYLLPRKALAVRGIVQSCQRFGASGLFLD